MRSKSLDIYRNENYSFIINGTNFNEYLETVSVRWRIDDVTRTFDATLTITESQILPNVSVNQTVQIYLNRRLYFNGFIEVVSPNYGGTSLKLQLQGRSVCSDLVDSTMGTHIEFSGRVSLQSIITQLNSKISALNLKIKTDYTEAVETLEEEQFKANPNTKIFDFLDRLARRFSLFVTSNAQGDIFLVNVSAQKKPSYFLTHQYNRINEALFSKNLYSQINTSNRFYEYRVHGKKNSNTGKGKVNKDSIYASASSFDYHIRPSRVLDIMMETDTVNPTILRKRADWEKATRLGRSINFSTEVFTLEDDKTKIPYEVNKIMRITDEATKVNDDLLIKGVQLELNTGVGLLLRLELTSADAFIPEPINPKKKSVRGKKLKKNTTSNRRRKNRSSDYNKRTDEETFVDDILRNDYKRDF